jgi:hypothetical protein
MFSWLKRKSDSDRPLKSDEKREVEDCIRGGLERVGATRDDRKSTTAIQKRILTYINEFRERSAPQDEVVDAALQVGCLWGHTVCCKLGWEWAFVTKEGNGVFAVVSPGREYVVFPMLYAQRRLQIKRLCFYSTC